jgi:hypothetical protein
MRMLCDAFLLVPPVSAPGMISEMEKAGSVGDTLASASLFLPSARDPNRNSAS